MERFGDLLRDLRVGRSLSQSELAERAGLTVKAIGALERGGRRRPRPQTVRALGQGLALDDAELRRLIRSVPARQEAQDDAGAGQRPATARSAAMVLPVLAPATGPLFGREVELAAIADLLREPARRIVTLSGPGGVGKSTLASAVVELVRDAFPAPAVVVALADVRDGALVIPRIAGELGLSETEDATVRALAAALARRRMLLVLDNFEQVLSAAPDVAALVAASPELVVLVTSRAALRLREEQEVRVARLSSRAALEMFHERVAARGVALGEDDHAAVTLLCERADGVPLALELAANAAARLGPAALMARLFEVGPRDLPPRQQSMAATLDWSLDLLEKPARALLGRLSVFVGSFPALAVVEAAPRQFGTADVEEPLALLVQLVEHTLVLPTAPVGDTARFRLLEPVREEVLTRLSPSELAEAQEAQVRAVLARARGINHEMRSGRQNASLAGLEVEIGNIRLVFARLLADAGDDATTTATELLWCLHYALAFRGHTREGVSLAERLAERPMAAATRLRLLLGWTGLLQFLGHIPTALALAEESFSIAERLGDRAGAAEAAFYWAANAEAAGDTATARRLLARLDELDEALDDCLRVYQAAIAGKIDILEGDLHAAAAALATAETRARRLGGSYDLAAVLLFRSWVDRRRDEHVQEAAHLAEAVLLNVELGSPQQMSHLAQALAGAAVRLGELEAGVRLLGAAGVHRAHLDAEDTYRDAAEPHGDVVATARSGLGEAAFAAAWQAGREMSATEIGALAATWGPARRT